RRSRRQRPEVRADLCGAVRRRRRCRGPEARAGFARLIGETWASHFRTELYGLDRAPRKAPALSGQARAWASAWSGGRRVPVRRHLSVLAAAGGAARPRFLLRYFQRQRARPRPRRL